MRVSKERDRMTECMRMMRCLKRVSETYGRELLSGSIEVGEVRSMESVRMDESVEVREERVRCVSWRVSGHMKMPEN